MYPDKFSECVNAAGGATTPLALMYKLAINLGARLEIGVAVFDDEEDFAQQPIVVLDADFGGLEAFKYVLGISKEDNTVITGDGETLCRVHGFEKNANSVICLELRPGVLEMGLEDILAAASLELFKPVKPTISCP